MKRYKQFMDGVKAPDTLRQRLRELKAPKKKPAAWKNCGLMAAVLALVLGLGSYAHYWNMVVDPRGQAFLDQTLVFCPNSDELAIEDPGESDHPGDTLGGYEFHEHEGMVSYQFLPHIEYGEADGEAQTSQVSADWDIPQGAARRELTKEEIIALMGGGDAVNTHLDWGGYKLAGWGAWYEDGSFWGTYITGIHASDTFEFSVTAGQLPPTCIAYPHSVTQEVYGLTLTADKCYIPSWISVPAGVTAPDVTHLTVSFMDEGYGYRFEVNSLNEEQAELLVSRLVCAVADDRLALYTVDPAAPKKVTCAVCGNTFPEGTVHDDPDYAPNEAADPQDDAPAVSVSDEPYMCTGYPVPESPDCSFGEPNREDGELCGLPLAPGGAADIDN